MKWNIEDECKKLIDEVTLENKIEFIKSDFEALCRYIKVVDNTVVFDIELMNSEFYEYAIDNVDELENEEYIESGTLNMLQFKQYVMEDKDEAMETYDENFWNFYRDSDNPSKKIIDDIKEFAKEHNKECYESFLELDKKLEEEVIKIKEEEEEEEVIPLCSNCGNPIIGNFCSECGTKKG